VGLPGWAKVGRSDEKETIQERANHRDSQRDVAEVPTVNLCGKDGMSTASFYEARTRRRLFPLSLSLAPGVVW